MKKSIPHTPVAPLSRDFVELANEIDGMVDLGITMSFISVVEPRDAFLEKHSARVLQLVEAIGSCGRVDGPDPDGVHAQLASAANRFLNALSWLRNHRSLDATERHSLPETVFAAWEAMHRSIRDLAETRGVLDDSWYAAIAERHAAYRAGLSQLEAALSTAE